MELEFEPGTVIQDYSEPFVKILSDNQKGKRCDNCFGKSFNLKQCAGCKLMHYCSKSCQVKDWKFAHKFECKSEFFKTSGINNSFMQPGEFTRQMFRIFSVLKLHPSKGQEKRQMYDGTTRCFDDLMSHQTKLKQDTRFLAFFQKMAGNLRQEGIPDIDNDEGINYLIRLAGIWKTNAIMIQNKEETEQIGGGIYIENSAFDHSCKPNAFAHQKGFLMQIRAIGPIHKGEKPYVTYLSGHRSRQERLQVLKERYNFDCHCKQCELEGKSGDAVDYNKLKLRIEKAGKTENLKTYLQLHEDILTMMQKLYEEFDQRITNRIFLTLQEAIGLDASKPQLQKLWKSAEEHLKKTYGVDYGDYQLVARQKILTI